MPADESNLSASVTSPSTSNGSLYADNFMARTTLSAGNKLGTVVQPTAIELDTTGLYTNELGFN